MAFSRFAAYRPQALSLLRIVAGFMFSLHGFQKVLGLLGGAGGSGNPAAVMSLPWVAGVLELVGGLLIMVGLFTAPVAFILSGEMAVAYFMAHLPQSFWPILNRGELAALYCFVFLYFAAAGPGPWSVDQVRSRPAGP
ncbi:MAG: DoxX family protein [Bryobacteraceae bacterium]|nr:DoxX family protein [Bryobacteraceae bacterium]